MKANFEKRTIEMTKSEANKAGKIGSPKFNELKAYREEYPDFKVEVIETKRKSSTIKGLDYDYMRNYINNCKKTEEEKNKLMDEFNALTTKIKKNDEEICEDIKAVSYAKVKKWFLGKFPEIKEYKEKHEKRVKDILAA